MIEVIASFNENLSEPGKQVIDFEIDNQLREHDGNDEKLALEAPGLEKLVMEYPQPAVDETEVALNDVNEKNVFVGIDAPDINPEAVADPQLAENVVREVDDVTKSSNQPEVLSLASEPVQVSPSPEQPAADAPKESANVKKETHRKIAGKKVAVRFDSEGDSIHDDSEEENKPAKNCKQKKGQPATEKPKQHKNIELPLNNEVLIDPLNEASNDRSEDDDDESSEFFSNDGIPVINIPLADLLKQNGLQLRRISESDEYSKESEKEVAPNFEDLSTELWIKLFSFQTESFDLTDNEYCFRY